MSENLGSKPFEEWDGIESYEELVKIVCIKFQKQKEPVFFEVWKHGEIFECIPKENPRGYLRSGAGSTIQEALIRGISAYRQEFNL